MFRFSFFLSSRTVKSFNLILILEQVKENKNKEGNLSIKPYSLLFRFVVGTKSFSPSGTRLLTIEDLLWTVDLGPSWSLEISKY